METRFVPALFSILQMRSPRLHPVGREALVRGISWYLMGTFLPDIPNEEEEKTFFINRWVVRFRDQERAWQKHLSDKNADLKSLAIQLMKNDDSKGGLGEMAAFALGAGVLARSVWRDDIEEDQDIHLSSIKHLLSQGQKATQPSGPNGLDSTGLDWEAFWQPSWVMQDLLRFPRVIEHTTKSCQNVFTTKMSGEALSRWSKLLHMRLYDKMREARNNDSEIAELHDATITSLEKVSDKYLDLLNALAHHYWDESLSSEKRFEVFRKIIEEGSQQPVDFAGWESVIDAKREKVGVRGRNPQPAFYQNPPTYPGETEPPLDESTSTSTTADFEPGDLPSLNDQHAFGYQAGDVNTDEPTEVGASQTTEEGTPLAEGALSLEAQTEEEQHTQSNSDDEAKVDSEEPALDSANESEDPSSGEEKSS